MAVGELGFVGEIGRVAGGKLPPSLFSSFLVQTNADPHFRSFWLFSRLRKHPGQSTSHQLPTPLRPQRIPPLRLFDPSELLIKIDTFPPSQPPSRHSSTNPPLQPHRSRLSLRPSPPPTTKKTRPSRQTSQFDGRGTTSFSLFRPVRAIRAL